jgi:hypothetical protein
VRFEEEAEEYLSWQSSRSGDAKIISFHNEAIEYLKGSLGEEIALYTPTSKRYEDLIDMFIEVNRKPEKSFLKELSEAAESISR